MSQQFFIFYFFGRAALTPRTYAGHSQIIVAVSALSNPQVHKLLIRGS
jgi:hypothetical protein